LFSMALRRRDNCSVDPFRPWSSELESVSAPPAYPAGQPIRITPAILVDRPVRPLPGACAASGGTWSSANRYFTTRQLVRGSVLASVPCFRRGLPVQHGGQPRQWPPPSSGFEPF
jgi:hypothetical protein